MTETQSLAEALPKQIQRNIELLSNYDSIGPVGNFAKQMIQHDINNANKAIMENDIVEMIRMYKVLEENN